MTSFSVFDTQMMGRAIQLARKGLYTTRPNPSVGCVLVQDSIIIGEGYHQVAGQGHAEVNALADAAKQGYSTVGATAYVTLEPCSHYGRTPPCALGLINAQVARVVIAVKDANPQVADNGIAMLQDAGIQVEVGLLAAEALTLNLGFMKRMKTGLPWVTVKVAASLDGKTALSNGVSKWITGPAARQDVQRMRARHCALITGVETIIADDPSLNVRYEELGSLKSSLSPTSLQQPLRVVLDSQARLTADFMLFSIETPILLVSTCGYSNAVQALFPNHVSLLQVKANSAGRVCLDTLLKYLGESCNSVMIEAGATLSGSFVEHNLVDELVLYQAPKLLGSEGRNMLTLTDYQSMDQIPKIVLKDQRNVGQDTRFVFGLS
ncbi:bifunctional diaminohydroxyphosphoribosylaminopyrimidine deaminase/5-amino-6-(5-phosphoribosylamino)uracil reductase RibD [Shewanella glacialimarina]|uniref:bifunctional diaminohydroxyphosphoribosylaminopyrimidine deaminase/5-amino-6-(5-phosphoribosylamino)uracil reductase RibD n=1 Tax=Shewanella glacialimarina TaxID=2590884 RepID=UPI001CF8A8AE|nr:bifunctional diaminohydroxyphosphoribosylaminopyrimidine deaminase/5-amino-6-(5-phosphoribosylamino)uracil reductase RibD [Shewanella glacialimarina]UCX05521.1 bifunctional diaminohydroxyphosphoribosylaminopyrimidine deaminase/5-amino-6-(5-phosphoribosylamino)uracil reductase RibD [Shewanella glacialimarina]